MNDEPLLLVDDDRRRSIAIFVANRKAAGGDDQVCEVDDKGDECRARAPGKAMSMLGSWKGIIQSLTNRTPSERPACIVDVILRI